jgi:hypothetical protein
MTSEVMEKRRVEVEPFLMLERFLSQPIQHRARGFICRKKTFNAMFSGVPKVVSAENRRSIEFQVTRAACTA